MGDTELQTEKGQASGQDFLQQEPEVGGPLRESGRRCLPGDTRTKSLTASIGNFFPELGNGPGT